MENKNFIEKLEEILGGVERPTYINLPLRFRRALEIMMPKEYESNVAINDNMSLDVIEDSNGIKMARYINYFGNSFIIEPDDAGRSYVNKGYNKGYVFVTLSELEKSIKRIYTLDLMDGIEDLRTKAMEEERRKVVNGEEADIVHINKIADKVYKSRMKKTGSQLLDEALAEIKEEVKKHPSIEPKAEPIEEQAEGQYIHGYMPIAGEGDPKGPRNGHYPLVPTEREYNAEYDKHMEEIEALFEGEMRIGLQNEVTKEVDQIGFVHKLDLKKDGIDGYMVFIEPADYNGEKPKTKKGEYIPKSGQVAYVSKEQYEMAKRLIPGTPHDEEIFGNIMQEILEKSSNCPVQEVYHRGEATGYIRRIEALVFGKKVRKDEKNKNYLYRLLRDRKEILGIEK